MSTAPKILCTPCLRGDQNVDAIKYCVECNENFCRLCLKNHIKEFASASKHHRLLNRDEMPEWMCGTSGSSNFCTRHTDNHLDSYCEDHDIACCGACVVIEHSLCENVRDLIPISSEVDPISDSDVLLKDLQSMTDAMRILQGNRRRDRSNMRKSTAKSLSSVRDFRQRVNDMFVELEKEAVDEIDTDCLEEENNIECDIRQSEGTVALLEMAIQQIGDAKDKTDVPPVVTNLNILNGKKLLKDTKKVYEEIQDRNVQLVNFTINRNVERYIFALKTFGSCKRQLGERSTMLITATKYVIDKEGDNLSYDFQDATQTEAGSFLLLDAENKCIKHLDESLKVTGTYPLVKMSSRKDTYEPFAGCLMTNDRIAVSLTREKVVRVYNITDSFEMLSEINIGEYCRGLTYSPINEELYVACGGGSYAGEGLGHIRVYSLQGELLRTFKQTSDGKMITSRPMHLSMDSDGSKLLIADSMKGITAVDTKGNILSVFTAPELEDPRGIIVDVNDDIIVCGHISNTVLRIKSDMKGYDILMTQANGISNPVSVCYDATRSKCLVISSSSNELSVFDV